MAARAWGRGGRGGGERTVRDTAAVALDLENLLAVVAGRADLALQHVGDGQVRGHLHEIRRAAGAASEQAARLAAVASGAAGDGSAGRTPGSRPGGGPDALERVDPAAVVEHVARLVQPLLGDGALLTVDPRSTYAVAARASELELVLLNLVRNARDAIGGGTAGSGRSIHIATDDLDVDGEQAERLRLALAGPHVAISVADTGSGIADDTVERMFEPFFTTRPAGARSGSGVGLAAVSAIVGRHEGSIAVETAVGAGTRITVFLPATATAAPPALPGLRLVRPEGARQG